MNITEDYQSFMNLGAIMEELEKASSNLGHVNLIVTGKSGTGKSTLINAVFRQQLAVEGVGKPVTQFTKLYESKGMPIRVYDTKGLELDRTVQKESIKDIKQLIKKQYSTQDEDKYIHAIWYCINTASKRVEDTELDIIKDLCSLEEAGVPVLIVFTQSFPKKVAEELEKTVKEEIGSLPQYRGCCTVLAKMINEGDIHIPAFGLDELINTTAKIIPDGLDRALINAQGVSINRKIKAAEKVMNGYIWTAVATGATPIPFSDAPLLVTAQTAMCAHITATFGISLNKAIIADIISTFLGTAGVTTVGKTVVSTFLKATGVGAIAGGIVSGTTAGLLTGALGRTYIAILTQIAKGELKVEELQTDSFKKRIKEMMKKDVKKEVRLKKLNSTEKKNPGNATVSSFAKKISQKIKHPFKNDQKWT